MPADLPTIMAVHLSTSAKEYSLAVIAAAAAPVNARNNFIMVGCG